MCSGCGAFGHRRHTRCGGGNDPRQGNRRIAPVGDAHSVLPDPGGGPCVTLVRRPHSGRAAALTGPRCCRPESHRSIVRSSGYIEPVRQGRTRIYHLRAEMRASREMPQTARSQTLSETVANNCFGPVACGTRSAAGALLTLTRRAAFENRALSRLRVRRTIYCGPDTREQRRRPFSVVRRSVRCRSAASPNRLFAAVALSQSGERPGCGLMSRHNAHRSRDSSFSGRTFIRCPAPRTGYAR